MAKKSKAKKKSKAYGKGSIRQLKGLEAVRERPGMFLGDPSSGDALHHLVWEVVDNAVDEHLAGHCTHIMVHLLPDGVVSVSDNGRGIPVGLHPEEGIDTLEMVMTSLHAGGKFDHDSYEESAGLHGVGVSAVNGVSEWCQASIHRDGHVWVQRYERGHAVTPVTRGAAVATTGTTIEWKRDLDIFSGVIEYDKKILSRRLEELAFLNPGLVIELFDQRKKKQTATKFHFEGGIKEYVGQLLKKKKPYGPLFYFTDKTCVELAFAWTTAGEEDLRCYSNNTYNRDGGTHLTGFKNGLTRLITSYAKEHNMLKGVGEGGLTGGDIREGLVAIVNLRLRDIAFSSQTKDKLVTPLARARVEELFKDQVEYYFKENPGVAKKITEKAAISARAREAARKAREQVKRKEFGDQLSLPGKLADCSSKRAAECEIFIVEGDSAGGSAKGARDRKYQAILPLRGKVLNIERASIDSILDNAEIGTIVTALGCGIEQTRSFNIKKLRYHKVVLMSDADVDGAHIKTLLLTFFYRCMPRLVHEGYVYVAQPPLYGARLGGSKNKYFFTDEDAYNEFYAELTDGERKRMRVTRYKGLGEMNPEELWATTLDPSARVLRPVTIDDAVQAELAFNTLMGSNVENRRSWIEDNAQYVGNVDV